MTFYSPTGGVEAWRILLADPVKHWKTGRSARSLAYCWESSGGFPPEVVDAIRGYESWASGLTPLIVIPEHKVPLPGGRRASQNDIFVLADSATSLVAMTVEGKVDEGFDRPVVEWLGADPSHGRRIRLEFLCAHLGLPQSSVMEIPYQLLHRTVSALIEAERFRATPAMLVHSWGEMAGYDEYSDFCALLGAEAGVDGFATGTCGGTEIALGWVQGDPRWLDA